MFKSLIKCEFNVLILFIFICIVSFIFIIICMIYMEGFLFDKLDFGEIINMYFEYSCDM